MRSAPTPAPRGGPAERFFWLALALLAIAVVVIARLLTPAAAGVGTHMQLGLPPCGFLLMTGLPCPACGLTTAFAYIARGDITLAVMAHPIGLPLFLIVITAAPISFYACLRPWPIVETIERLRAERVALYLAVAVLLTWAARLLAKWIA